MDISSEGLWEMFEGDSADTVARKLPLVSMGGRAEGLTCADLGARTPSALAKFFALVLSLTNDLFWLIQTNFKLLSKFAKFIVK